MRKEDRWTGVVLLYLAWYIAMVTIFDVETFFSSGQTTFFLVGVFISGVGGYILTNSKTE